MRDIRAACNAIVNREVNRLSARLGLPKAIVREWVLKEAAKPCFNKWQRRAIWARSGGLCAHRADPRCDSPNKIYPDYWHADHVIPRSMGGPTLVENGQALCIGCNLIKSRWIEVD